MMLVYYSSKGEVWFSTWWISRVLYTSERSWSSRSTNNFGYILLCLFTKLHTTTTILLTTSILLLLLLWCLLLLLRYWISSPWGAAWLWWCVSLLSCWLAYSAYFTIVSPSIIATSIIVSETEATLPSWLMMHLYRGDAIYMPWLFHDILNFN